jgi:hypothetical protein
MARYWNLFSGTFSFTRAINNKLENQDQSFSSQFIDKPDSAGRIGVVAGAKGTAGLSGKAGQVWPAFWHIVKPATKKQNR